MTVKKEGNNKGKKFFVCGMPQDKKCEFFEWAPSDALYREPQTKPQKEISFFQSTVLYNTYKNRSLE